MSAAYKLLFDQALSRVEPELAHELGFRAIRVGSPAIRAAQRLVPEIMSTDLRLSAMGLTFPHPLGLAAGFDKNGIGIDALASLGFGHVEIGTVTALPQPGNPKPRLFRLPRDAALVNRMGFNNDGAEVVAARLAAREAKLGASPRQVVLGVNIGKSKVVADDDQAAVLADYGRSTRALAPFAGYLVVNVSSPNTPGLRNLQEVTKLRPLLAHVRQTADATVTNRKVPLLVKIAPDLSDDEVGAVAGLVSELGLDGVIATNTTVERSGLRTPAAEIAQIGVGGLSGAPLQARSLAVLKLLRSALPDGFTLVSVGGITTAADACERLAAGATLIQAYSAFIYQGPTWPIRIVRGISSQDQER